MITYQLFYRQCIHVDDFPLYVSDMKAYMQTALGQESGYEFPYPVFFALIRLVTFLCPVEQATALVTTVLNTASVLCLVYFLEKDLGDNKNIWKKALILMAAVSLVFVSMLYAPSGVYLPGMDHKYLGVFTANPYHNATYLATRPFSIVAFYLFLRIRNHYEEKIEKGEAIGFTVALLLTTMTKPSFTLVFGMAAAVVLIIGLIRGKGKNIRQTILFAVCFLPTVLDLLYQYKGVFEAQGSAEETGIGIGFFSAWSLYCHNIPLAIVLALAFPGLYLVLHLPELKKDKTFRFSWVMMACAFFSLAFLYEKGDRFDDLNFSWGYMHGIFFVFAVSLTRLIKDSFLFLEEKKKSGKTGMLLSLEWLAYLWHLGCGIKYFLYLYNGFEHMAF
ncbi:MAG: hypothetical protein K5682_09185 [Lachnospiraceae bacterium]|nr:hypothetical protein [Lachnospiraceae bacterium]